MIKLMKVLDNMLFKLGLIRSSVNQRQINSYKSYTQTLGQAAKDAGVKVLFEKEFLTGVEIDTDLFILGNQNYIVDCSFTGSKLRIAPQCCNNHLSGNLYTNGEPMEFHNVSINIMEQ